MIDKQAEFISFCFEEVLIGALSKLVQEEEKKSGVITLIDLKRKLNDEDFGLLSLFATGEEKNVSYVVEEE